MTVTVIDASAMLALFHQEPRWQQVVDHIGSAIINIVKKH